MRKAYKDLNLTGLFDKVANCAHMYAREAESKGEWYGDKDNPNWMPPTDQLPHAMLYKARGCEQFIDEIKSRANDMLQKAYDVKSVEEKIKFHQKESDMYRGWINDGIRRKEVIEDYEQSEQEHESHIFALEVNNGVVSPENQYKFGE